MKSIQIEKYEIDKLIEKNYIPSLYQSIQCINNDLKKN